MRNLAQVLALMLYVGLLLGCKSSNASDIDANGAKDPSDATISPDTDGQVSDDVTFGDASAFQCESSCTEFLDYHCVPDPDTGVCKDCLEDFHCQNNSRSFGPMCVNKLCACTSHNDCGGTSRGSVCRDIDAELKVCGCENDDDCGLSHPFCIGQLFNKCTEPCTADADCEEGGRVRNHHHPRSRLGLDSSSNLLTTAVARIIHEDSSRERQVCGGT